MVKTDEAFTVVVQRRPIGELDFDPQVDLFPALLGDIDEESVARGRYLYRVIATNLNMMD